MTLQLTYALTIDPTILRGELPAVIRAHLTSAQDVRPGAYSFAGCVLDFDTALTDEQIDAVAALVTQHAARLASGYYVSFAKYQSASKVTLATYQKRLTDRTAAFRAQWNAFR